MYRRKLKVLNRNKLIVFIGSHFGIFPSHEVFILASIPVQKTEKEFDIDRERLYAKYTDVSLTENFLEHHSSLFHPYIGIPDSFGYLPSFMDPLTRSNAL